MSSGSHGRPPPKPQDPLVPVERQTKWGTWAKLMVGIVAAIFVAGFGAAQFVAGIARTEDVRNDLAAAQARHDAAHSTFGDRLKVIEDRTSDIRVDQVRAEERARLINARIELLLERTEASGQRRVVPARETLLMEVIEQQERRVEAVDSNRAGTMAGIDRGPPGP